jgi:cysteinyl-tRNA synthetase
MHNGFVNINKEKMSKSLGNILTIKEILEDWHPEVLRLFFLSHHYRSPVDYAEDSFLESKSGLDRFYHTLNAVQEELKKPALPGLKKVEFSVIENVRKAIESFPFQLEEAMDDDFNTAQALGYFFDLQRSLNSLLDISKGHPTEEIVLILKQGLDHFFLKGWIFGLFREDPQNYLNQQKKEGLKKLNLTEDEILKFIMERGQERKEL